MSALPSLTETQRVRRQQRRFIKDGSVPENALIWRGNRARGKALRLWRSSVSRAFSARPRCLRVAWMLEWLFGKKGYAFPTDAFLGNELGMNQDHVQEALKDLERGGAIIRASVFVRDKPERRIWPNESILPPDTRGKVTPRRRANDPPDARGQTSQEGSNFPKTFLSRTVLEARRAAQINQQRERRTVESPEDAA
ncbi:hypothetical protein [Afipia felis]|uniref:Uncharacterized protein n=2 Tax=Afipia felis TaxID=1035 RepID=A0A380W7P6_AFIFE|nr:hypothetical protein [Afipia felis]EKS28156.1 hypothetical protein HMPREF9697_00684 [Afipia felis ATCC 53690]SUU76866.1 Uncharacterised protein [Afipia felis]SUU84932.1 Uncharacterised protein [Afipia felis]